MFDDATLEFFQTLFRGRRDAWGSVKGKCNKEPVTDGHFRLHLEGKQSLGVYMLQDDATCFFAVVDLDEKDFNKAKAIRQELLNNGLYAHISESKSKGYHIWLFFKDKVVARDIRRALLYVLTKLNITAEIFPKQSQLTESVPYGNYINLPCFGYSRHFITVNLNTVPVTELSSKVRYNQVEPLARLLTIIPEEKPIMPEVVTTPSHVKKKPPPCIARLSKGVAAGVRDVAAFAIARHLLDQQFIPEEVLGLLVTWDKSNQPPLNDKRLLETKVRSAQKGYTFGCNSITSEPLLAVFCVGEEQCDWQKAVTRERMKQGLIQYAAM